MREVAPRAISLAAAALLAGGSLVNPNTTRSVSAALNPTPDSHILTFTDRTSDFKWKRNNKGNNNNSNDNDSSRRSNNNNSNDNNSNDNSDKSKGKTRDKDQGGKNFQNNAAQEPNGSSKPAERPEDRRPIPHPIRPVTPEPVKPVDPIDAAIEACIAEKKKQNPDPTKYHPDRLIVGFKNVTLDEALSVFRKEQIQPAALDLFEPIHVIVATELRRGIFEEACRLEKIYSKQVERTEFDGIVHHTSPRATR